MPNISCQSRERLVSGELSGVLRKGIRIQGVVNPVLVRVSGDRSRGVVGRSFGDSEQPGPGRGGRGFWYLADRGWGGYGSEFSGQFCDLL